MDTGRRVMNSHTEDPSRFGLLNSIGAVFEQRKKEREEKRQADKVKEDVARAHSLYLQENVVCQYEYGRAGEAVNRWVRESGGAVAEKARKELERKEQEGNFPSPTILTASGKRKRASKTTSSSSETLNPHSYINRKLFVSESNKKHCRRNPHIACTSLLDSSSEMLTVNHTGSDIIDLDSNEDVIDLTSNSSSPNLNYAGNNTDSPYMCVVMNCGIIFDSVETCFAHNSTFSHNACNPFKHLVDSTLPEHPLMYICPKCEEIFQRRVECQEHMIYKNHYPIASPIPICGYMCPQCFLVFKNLIECHTHMSDLNHHRVSYAFPSDVSGKSACSIPLSKYMAQEFYKKCAASPYEVKCTQCDVVVMSAKEKEQHRFHSLVSLSSLNPEDVFAAFLTDKACNECGKIVWEDNGDKEFHVCDDHTIGWLVDHGCRTFKEYIRRCSILTNSHDDTALVVTVSDSENDTEPSVSTWIMNSRNQKVEQFPDYNNPFHSGPVTRSSNKTPSKRFLRLSMDNISTPSSFDRRENFESNNSAHSVNQSKEDSEEVMELGSPGKLTKKDRRRLQRKLKKALIQRNIMLPSTNDVNTSFTEPTTSSTHAAINSPDNKTEISDYLNSDIEILTCSGNVHTNRPTESYPSDEQTGDNIPAHKLRASPTKLSKSAKKKNKNCESKQDQVISKPCTSINTVCDSEGDISTSNLSKMHLLIFLDLDNWPGFFKKLPRCLPDKTFVWTFYGGHTVWRPPKSIAFIKLNKSKCFHLHSQCGKTKDAADFAICFTIGKMDDRLPQTVPFAILSGDRGFCEIERQMKNTSRRTVVIDPHEAHKHSNDMIYTMILSVVQP